MSAHGAGTDRLARGDSRNVAELAHMTGRLRLPVRGMPLTGAGRLAERDAEETLFTIPIGLGMAGPNGIWPCPVRDIAVSKCS